MRKLSKRIFAFLLAAVMLLPMGIFSENPFVQEASAASPTVTVDTGSEHYSIGETNAVLCGKVTNPNNAKVSKLGIKLYDASGTLLKDHSESSTFTVTPVYMWFNVNTEMGYTLKKGTTYQYQMYADVGGTRYTSSKATFTTTDADKAQLAIMPLRDIKVTQGAGGSYSHKGTKNVDFGKSQNLYAPFDCKVVYKDTSYAGGNSIIIESTSKVKFADGTYDYMCVLTAHDNDISDLSKGKSIKAGTVYYHTGTYGNVTGEHVHMCVAKGKYAGQYQNSDGNWELKNSILPSNAFYIDPSTKISSAGGYTWKKVPTLSVYYNANGGSISSDSYYLSSGIVYTSSNSSKLVHKWTYNNPQTNGLWDDTSFGIYKNGYTFVGWGTSASGGTIFDKKDNTLLPSDINSNIKNGDCSTTLYAIWKQNATYTLTYNANGGSGAPSSQSGATSYTVSSAKPTRSGYTFLGWATSSTATSATYVGGDSISLSSNTTLYAVWKKITYTLTYNANGGSGAPSSQSGATSYTVSSTKPTRSGYTFLGWSTSSSATSASYVGGNTISLSANTTLYAVWDEIPVYNAYNLVYNANGGTGAPESEIFMEGEIINISLEVPIRFGYVFDGWEGTYGVYAPGDEVAFYENTVLKAKWCNYEILDGEDLLINLDECVKEFYVKFIPKKSGDYVFKTTYTGDYLDTIGILYDSSEKLLESSDDNSSDYNFEIIRYLEAGKVYYIFVESYNNAEGSTYLCVSYSANEEPSINPEPGYLDIDIKTPSTSKINYKDGIILHAEVSGELPEGSSVVWEASNGNFIIYNVDKTSCKIISYNNGLTDIIVKIVDENGEVLAQDYVTMTSNASLFQKIIVFIKELFGILPVVLSQSIK